VFPKESPTYKTGHYQYARGDGEYGLYTSALLSGLELREISITGAAGSQVIEPLLRFGEWITSYKPTYAG